MVLVKEKISNIEDKVSKFKPNKRIKRIKRENKISLAESERFELSKDFHLCTFSKRVVSATHPTLQIL